MWNASFEDGITLNSKQYFWTDLPKDKKMVSVQLFNSRFPDIRISLSSNYDAYYYSREAMANVETQETAIVAEVVGAHDHRMGIGIEIRLDYNGGVSVKHYAIDRFFYSKDILVAGKRKVAESVAA